MLEKLQVNVSPVARNRDTIAFFLKLGFMNLGYVGLFIDFTGQTWKSGFQMNDRTSIIKVKPTPQLLQNQTKIKL
jgi:hypothetical protein